MKKNLISLLVLVLVLGAAYYIIFRNLPKEETVVNTDSTYNYTTNVESPTTTETQIVPTAVTPTTPVSNKSAPTEITVNIRNFAFNPTTLNVKVGTKVTWTNNDSAPHTVTSDTGSILDSKTLASGESFSYTFTGPITEKYHCAIHPMMKASVVVTN